MTGAATLVVGYVARAHGITGELGVRTFDVGSEALDDVERLEHWLKVGAQPSETVAGLIKRATRPAPAATKA